MEPPPQGLPDVTPSRLTGAHETGVIAGQEPGRDPLELVGRKASEQLPGEVERLVDGAPLHTLVDKPPLEVFNEPEQASRDCGP